MLINCKECNHQISDIAVKCPHCGAPTPAAQSMSLYALALLIGLGWVLYHFWREL